MNLPSFRQTTPSIQEMSIAREITGIYTKQTGFPKLSLKDVTSDRFIELPESIVGVLMSALKTIASGRGVTVVPENAELTTVEASDILSVSRPYLIKLLDEKKIPFRKVGKHRRILMEDIMRYKKNIDAEREKTLDALTAQAQQDGMGY